jgi:hypothetical protein
LNLGCYPDPRSCGTDDIGTGAEDVARALTLQDIDGGSQDEFPVLDALRRDEHIRHFLDVGRPALHDDDFETIIVVQVDVQSGKDRPVIFVLKSRQFFPEQTNVMVVEQRHGAHHRRRRLL